MTSFFFRALAAWQNTLRQFVNDQDAIVALAEDLVQMLLIGQEHISIRR